MTTAAKAPIRVVVVDDSATARLALSRIINAAPGMRVVGHARDGNEAVGMVVDLRPDVVTMDIRMPGMDGYEATRRIMIEQPTPVVMISGVDPDDVSGSFAAMDAGAVTVLSKPAATGGGGTGRQGNEIVNTLRSMSGLQLITRREDRQAARETRGGRRNAPAVPSRRVDIVGIGASTGGPAALASILRALNEPPPVPILIVQHIAEGFDGGLVSWLSSTSKLPVHLAEHGEIPRRGEVLIAPHGYHLRLSRSGRIMLSDDPPLGGHRPAATHMFSSLAESAGSRAAGVILTGIGRDGADGLQRLRSAGGWVVAQDGASAVVDGMPKAVRDAGTANVVAPLGEIPSVLRAAWEVERPSPGVSAPNPSETSQSSVKSVARNADPGSQ